MGLLVLAVATVYVLKEDGATGCAEWIRCIQIEPEVTLSALGVLVFWLVMTIMFGRVYCAAVCPVGVLQDIVRWCVVRLPKCVRPKQRTRYKPPFKGRYNMLAVYVVALAVGAAMITLLFFLTPWTLYTSIVRTLELSAMTQRLMGVTVSAAAGMVCGVAGLLTVVSMSLYNGRDLCNEFCPVGAVMMLTLKPFAGRSIVNIDINPDVCTHCMKCEEVCPAHCIEVKTNRIDNDRCVRCFDCLDACTEDAIQYTSRRPQLGNTLGVNG